MGMVQYNISTKKQVTIPAKTILFMLGMFTGALGFDPQTFSPWRWVCVKQFGYTIMQLVLMTCWHNPNIVCSCPVQPPKKHEPSNKTMMVFNTIDGYFDDGAPPHLQEILVRAARDSSSSVFKILCSYWWPGSCEWLTPSGEPTWFAATM